MGKMIIKFEYLEMKLKKSKYIYFNAYKSIWDTNYYDLNAIWINDLFIYSGDFMLLLNYI